MTASFDDFQVFRLHGGQCLKAAAIPMSDEAATTDPIEPPTQRRRRALGWPLGFRATAVLFVVLLWAALLGTWIACNRSTGWQQWLANLKFPGAESKGSHSQTGRRADGPGELAYFGDGKAELGEFSVKIFDPVTGTALRTDFRLEGQTVYADEGAFEQFMKNNNRFFREQVMVTVRNCELRDLVDPDLKLLEKKLVSRVNRALGRRILKSTRIKDFDLLESTDNSSFVQREWSDDAAIP